MILFSSTKSKKWVLCYDTLQIKFMTLKCCCWYRGLLSSSIPCSCTHLKTVFLHLVMTLVTITRLIPYVISVAYSLCSSFKFSSLKTQYFPMFNFVLSLTIAHIWRHSFSTSCNHHKTDPIRDFCYFFQVLLLQNPVLSCVQLCSIPFNCTHLKTVFLPLVTTTRLIPHVISVTSFKFLFFQVLLLQNPVLSNVTRTST